MRNLGLGVGLFSVGTMAPWSSSLRGSVLSKYATNTTFRQIQFAAHMINADTATRGA